MRKGLSVIALCAAFVSACSPNAAPRSASAGAAASAGGFRTPVVQNERGLESIIGKGANALTQRFGSARIDLSEGDARKLQFSSNECVLDIFLYPLRGNEAPVATHVEARQRVGGAGADRARCIADIEQGRNGG
ncbi:hypothetical protein INR77_01410 [Erythrobacter sp. SCSIO 43205]|uniref:hypothetical protein n=1 Tax=Erythrobacter sp. SCSIO 43205 TaxID=2779361 RepID=UPI001CA874BC|nr:hypothetical protein [Erythrobacter sp. SCSIO 43205]UAB78430.1 hypothetical protein INR77_01410 [Erythrobacter sp. SCSIO 43205]